MAVLMPRLRRFASGLTGGSTADADDLVQAACERALGRLHQWRPDTRFDSWMFRIIQTVWFNELATRKHRREEPLEGLEGRVGEDGVRHTEARLLLTEVQRAFAGLPGEQRVVLILVCVEGYTYREAAETLGIPVGTVMSRVARGRLALFDMLQAAPKQSTDNIVHLG